MIRNSIFLVIALILVSCGKKNIVPPGVLSPGKMQVVLWDIIRAEAYTTHYIKTSVTRNAVEENAKLQQQIFAMHQVSKDEFYQSFSYYKTHTGLMKPILDSMINKASREPSYNFKPVPQTEK